NVPVKPAVAATVGSAPPPAATAPAQTAYSVPEALHAPPPGPKVDLQTPFATTTPRNDASSVLLQWDLQNAYKYFSEANAGYHFDVNHGLNVDAGVFVSYIGLFSYYNFYNWTYQPSFGLSNTPWFVNGLSVQWWPTQNLKIEPWLINGWQSYAKFNSKPGVGGQILWMPNDSLKLVFNSYSVGQDNLPCQANGSRGTIDVNCQPQNGGYGNAAAGANGGGGPPGDY